MTFAQIKDGMVANIMSIEDGSDPTPFADGFDAMVDLTGVDPMPGIGWAYSVESGFENTPAMAEEAAAAAAASAKIRAYYQKPVVREELLKIIQDTVKAEALI